MEQGGIEGELRWSRGGGRICLNIFTGNTPPTIELITSSLSPVETVPVLSFMLLEELHEERTEEEATKEEGQVGPAKEVEG